MGGPRIKKPVKSIKPMNIKILRHSTAHILAQAVKELYPEAKLGIGPAIEEGFYYDFDYPKGFTPEDLERIEKKMHLCRGPHLNSTGEIKAFKLLSTAGAYWRGKSENKMLQRIYGTAFEDKKDLERYVKNLKEAKKRDHRKLGKELDLFSFHPEAPAAPFYHPKGVILYQNLIDFWRKEHQREDYLEIKTPLILEENLWKQSGHYEHYREHIYFTELAGRRYAVRPMNCPGCLLFYKEKQHSYRELPLRFAELGLVHRQELSGVTHGLFRAKAFTIDDAHIFCLPSQLTDEIIKVSNLILRVYKILGFEEYSIELSTRPESSIGTDQMWEEATNSLREALKKNKIDYEVKEGEGAFYGPKIDFHIKDCLQRTWQCGTIQVDFSMPERFNLEYIDKNSQRCPVVMIHRAVFGSIERFLGILIEHYGGAFPLWLAPLQMRIITIAQRHIPYAQEVQKRLQDASLRVDTDFRDEKVGYKIRGGELQKIPFLLIIGDKEEKEGNIAVRERGKGDVGRKEIEKFIEEISNHKFQITNKFQ
ncbi:MAG: threonine--tRNA ligase [Candidatus Omnitrophica bacterium 4484_213]|nr:MAG: threonine--tRNA ligase [Candidatus Omnitrophica bacterium 4484_213]